VDSCLVDIELPGRAMARASLHLSIVNPSGELPQGNVFVVLRHEPSGEMWRTLRWHRSTRSFLFTDLPGGPFTYRVWTSPDRESSGRLELGTSGAHHAFATLPPEPVRRRLEFPIRGRLASWRSRIAACRLERDDRELLQRPLRDGSAGHILVDLLADGAIVASVTRPIAELGITPELWSYIQAHTRGRANSPIIGRARFVIITCCVGLNRAVRPRLAPLASPQEIWSAILRVAATLDDPDLDDVFLWAARVHHPETALFEQFARAWAERFNGLNNLRSPIPLPRDASPPSSSFPGLPDLPEPTLDPPMVYTSAPVLADIAHILSSSLEVR
jgi:hypothetical protein